MMVLREPGVVQEGFPEEVSKKAPRERKNRRWGRQTEENGAHEAKSVRFGKGQSSLGAEGYAEDRAASGEAEPRSEGLHPSPGPRWAVSVLAPSVPTWVCLCPPGSVSITVILSGMSQS